MQCSGCIMYSFFIDSISLFRTCPPVMAQNMSGWLAQIKPTSNSDGEMDAELDSDFDGSLSELGIDLTNSTYNNMRFDILCLISLHSPSTFCCNEKTTYSQSGTLNYNVQYLKRKITSHAIDSYISYKNTTLAHVMRYLMQLYR